MRLDSKKKKALNLSTLPVFVPKVGFEPTRP